MLYAVFRRTVISLLNILSLLLLIRALLSWFPDIRGGRLAELLHIITEPVLLPFKTLFGRLGIGRNIPIDLSFLATIITLQIIASVL